MFTKLAKLVIHKPVKTLLVISFIILIFVIGVTKIEFATGNDTLIKPSTDVYQDNLALEENFGSDPIIILYEAENIESLLTLEKMEKLEELESYLSHQKAVFSITSPVTILKQISTTQYIKYQDGLNEITIALNLIGNKLKTINQNIESNSSDHELNQHITQLIDAQEQLYQATLNLISGYDNINLNLNQILDSLNDLNTDEPQTLQQINQSLTQLTIQIVNMVSQSENLPNIPQQTKTALQTIQTKLTEINTNQQTLAQQLGQLGNNLIEMSHHLDTMLQYSDVMKPGIPSKQETLNFMIYTDNPSLKPMFSDFIIDSRYMMITIKLNPNTTDEEKDELINSIHQILDDESITISGKPVLDLSIKTSMKTSIQNMMILSIISMIIVLSLTFKVKWRLFPLIMILIAVIGTIGLMGWIHIPITMVSMAVFPILIGLGIDYGIQFQSRYVEETEDVNHA